MENPAERIEQFLSENPANIITVTQGTARLAKQAAPKYGLTLQDIHTLYGSVSDFLKTLHNIERIEVLPYHALGVYKWDELGIPYTLRDAEPPTQERVDNAQRILNEALNPSPSRAEENPK